MTTRRPLKFPLMIDGINYYQILGVPEDALLKEIQICLANLRQRES